MKRLHAYKMRAECAHDVGHFLQAVHVDSLSVVRARFPGEDVAFIPDVDVAFKSTLPLAEIQELLRGIPDGHVMAESVNLAAKYTGERNEGGW